MASLVSHRPLYYTPSPDPPALPELSWPPLTPTPAPIRTHRPLSPKDSAVVEPRSSRPELASIPEKLRPLFVPQAGIRRASAYLRQEEASAPVLRVWANELFWPLAAVRALAFCSHFALQQYFPEVAESLSSPEIDLDTAVGQYVVRMLSLKVLLQLVAADTEHLVIEVRLPDGGGGFLLNIATSNRIRQTYPNISLPLSESSSSSRRTSTSSRTHSSSNSPASPPQSSPVCPSRPNSPQGPTLASPASAVELPRVRSDPSAHAQVPVQSLGGPTCSSQDVERRRAELAELPGYVPVELDEHVAFLDQAPASTPYTVNVSSPAERDAEVESTYPGSPLSIGQPNAAVSTPAPSPASRSPILEIIEADPFGWSSVVREVGLPTFAPEHMPVYEYGVDEFRSTDVPPYSPSAEANPSPNPARSLCLNNDTVSLDAACGSMTVQQASGGRHFSVQKTSSTSGVPSQRLLTLPELPASSSSVHTTGDPASNYATRESEGVRKPMLSCQINVTSETGEPDIPLQASDGVPELPHHPPVHVRTPSSEHSNADTAMPPDVLEPAKACQPGPVEASSLFDVPAASPQTPSENRTNSAVSVLEDCPTSSLSYPFVLAESDEVELTRERSVGDDRVQAVSADQSYVRQESRIVDVPKEQPLPRPTDSCQPTPKTDIEVSMDGYQSDQASQRGFQGASSQSNVQSTAVHHVSSKEDLQRMPAQSVASPAELSQSTSNEPDQSSSVPSVEFSSNTEHLESIAKPSIGDTDGREQDVCDSEVEHIADVAQTEAKTTRGATSALTLVAPDCRSARVTSHLSLELGLLESSRVFNVLATSSGSSDAPALRSIDISHTRIGTCIGVPVDTESKRLWTKRRRKAPDKLDISSIVYLIIVLVVLLVILLLYLLRRRRWCVACNSIIVSAYGDVENHELPAIGLVQREVSGDVQVDEGNWIVATETLRAADQDCPDTNDLGIGTVSIAHAAVQMSDKPEAGTSSIAQCTRFAVHRVLSSSHMPSAASAKLFVSQPFQSVNRATNSGSFCSALARKFGSYIDGMRSIQSSQDASLDYLDIDLAASLYLLASCLTPTPFQDLASHNASVGLVIQDAVSSTNVTASSHSSTTFVSSLVGSGQSEDLSSQEAAVTSASRHTYSFEPRRRRLQESVSHIEVDQIGRPCAPEMRLHTATSLYDFYTADVLPELLSLPTNLFAAHPPDSGTSSFIDLVLSLARRYHIDLRWKHCNVSNPRQVVVVPPLLSRAIRFRLPSSVFVPQSNGAPQVSSIDEGLSAGEHTSVLSLRCAVILPHGLVLAQWRFL